MPAGKRAPGIRVAVAVAVLCLGTLLAYWQLPRNGFVGLDDQEYLTENLRVRAGLTWEGVRWAFSSREVSNYGHPLTWISHMIDAELFGLRPAGHHLMNLAFHVANAILLLLLLQRMTGAFGKSALVALLFALHPLKVEPVAWAAERKEVLSAFFALLTLLAYVLYRRRPGLSRYWPVPVLFAAALAAKPMPVALPFLVILLEFWPLGGLQALVAPPGERPASRMRERGLRVTCAVAPLLALAAVSGIVTFQGESLAGNVKTAEGYPLPLRLQNAVVAYGTHVQRALWPAGLAFPYSHPGSFAGLRVAGFSVSLLLVSVLSVLLWRRLPFLPVGWFWYVGMLVPVIGLVRAHDFSMADRHTYLPLTGVFTALVWWSERLVGRSARLRSSAVAAAIVLLVLLGTLAARQTAFWRDPVTLFSHAIRVSPDNYLAEYDLGSALVLGGRLEASLPHFKEALRLRPGYVEAHTNLGYALSDLGRFPEARMHFLAAIRLRPQGVEAYNNLGVHLLREGRYEEAVGYLRMVVGLRPSVAAAWNNLGFALFSLGRKEEAIASYREALRLNPADENAQYNLRQAVAAP